MTVVPRFQDIKTLYCALRTRNKVLEEKYKAVTSA